MNKAHRCFLHLACAAVKASQGQDFRWHIQHMLREFGLGEFGGPDSRLKQCQKQTPYVVHRQSHLLS